MTAQLLPIGLLNTKEEDFEGTLCQEAAHATVLADKRLLLAVERESDRYMGADLFNARTDSMAGTISDEETSLRAVHEEVGSYVEWQTKRQMLAVESIRTTVEEFRRDEFGTGALIEAIVKAGAHYNTPQDSTSAKGTFRQSGTPVYSKIPISDELRRMVDQIVLSGEVYQTAYDIPAVTEAINTLPAVVREALYAKINSGE